MNKTMTALLKIIFFGICLSAVVLGQKEISYRGLFVMLLGLSGLLVLLWDYNRKYQ